MIKNFSCSTLLSMELILLPTIVGILKGTATLKACEPDMQVLNKPCNLPQTQSKSDIN